MDNTFPLKLGGGVDNGVLGVGIPIMAQVVPTYSPISIGEYVVHPPPPPPQEGGYMTKHGLPQETIILLTLELENVYPPNTGGGVEHNPPKKVPGNRGGGL